MVNISALVYNVPVGENCSEFTRTSGWVLRELMSPANKQTKFCVLQRFFLKVSMLLYLKIIYFNVSI